MYFAVQKIYKTCSLQSRNKTILLDYKRSGIFSVGQFKSCYQLRVQVCVVTTLVGIHTPLEGSSRSEQCARLMTFTQPFYDISGIQNRKEQNFLARTFSVIAILRYATFPYCFYYIAILQLSHFREIFTILLVNLDRMYLES